MQIHNYTSPQNCERYFVQQITDGLIKAHCIYNNGTAEELIRWNPEVEEVDWSHPVIATCYSNSKYANHLHDEGWPVVVLRDDVVFATSVPAATVAAFRQLAATMIADIAAGNLPSMAGHDPKLYPDYGSVAYRLRPDGAIEVWTRDTRVRGSGIFPAPQRHLFADANELAMWLCEMPQPRIPQRYDPMSYVRLDCERTGAIWERIRQAFTTS